MVSDHIYFVIERIERVMVILIECRFKEIESFKQTISYIKSYSIAIALL